MRYNFFIRTFLVVVVFTTSLCNTYAQYTSDNGHFTVDEIKGCVPLSIIVTSNEISCPCNATCPCDVWPDATNNPNDFTQNDLTINYTTPGTYTLQVQLQNFEKDIIQIEVLENTAPAFELTTCTANQVNVTIQDSDFDTYEIDYNDGSIININNGQLVPTYTYATSGTQSINVRGVNNNAADNCITVNSQTVEILPSLQDAAINSFILKSSTEADLVYTPQYNTNYHLQIAINDDSNFQRYLANAVEFNETSLTINDSNLDFGRNYYCFRIGTFDKCSNTYTGYSNTICSIDLNNISVDNNELILDWNTSASNVNEFVISKNTDSNYFSVQTNSFTDRNNILCNIDYCFGVKACYDNSCLIYSSSTVQCATAKSTDIPTAIADINIDITTPNIDGSWELPLSFTPLEYHIYRHGSSSADTVLINNFTDINVDQMCYQIDYIDACLNNSDISKEVCSIYLEHKISAGTVSLSWNDYNGWANGVNDYNINVESSTGNTTYFTSSASFELPEETTNTQQIKVTIQAVPIDGNLTSINSNSIEIINSANINFPNAFVPDGINNTFNVKGRYIQTVDIKIYTRWGEMIVNITDKENGWDGNIGAKSAASGTYIYVAEILDEAGNNHSRTGEILLIRK